MVKNVFIRAGRGNGRPNFPGDGTHGSEHREHDLSPGLFHQDLDRRVGRGEGRGALKADVVVRGGKLAAGIDTEPRADRTARRSSPNV